MYVICEEQGHQGHSACNDDDEKGQKRLIREKDGCYNVVQDILGIFLVHFLFVKPTVLTKLLQNLKAHFTKLKVLCFE